MQDLSAMTCVPCMGGIPPLDHQQIVEYLKQLNGGWTVVADHHLRRTFTFPDFISGLRFTNQVGSLAEEQGHHPDIFLAWGRVEISIWTHKIDGLNESDFILAAKIDKLASASGLA